MGYFRELPNIEYQSFLSNAISSQDYITVKNLFRRNKLRDDLNSSITMFDKYKIVEGARPDMVAEEYYGDAQLDWVVLLTAGIMNIRDEWPLSNFDLYYFLEDKYHGDYTNIDEHLNETHHFESKELKNSQGKIVLPAGIILPSTKKSINFNIMTDESLSPAERLVPQFEFSYFDNKKLYKTIIYRQESIDDNQYQTDINQLGENVIRIQNKDIMRAITNWEYESIENEKKSTIYLLKREYLSQFLTDMRDIMTYQRYSEYVDDRTIRTENTKNTLT